MKANTRLLCQENSLYPIYFPYKVNTIQYFEGGTVQMVIDPLLNQIPGLSTDEVYHGYPICEISLTFSLPIRSHHYHMQRV